MAQQTINIGASPNDGTGTPLRTAFQYTNSNFSELYTAVGPSGNNIVVPGNATITGDLTVDTSTLKVDSANNRVGIGTASPAAIVDINGTTVRPQIQATSNGTGSTLRFIGKTNAGVTTDFDIGINLANQNSFELWDNVNSQVAFQYLNTGTHRWYLAGTTAMTLNSTGLGVGDTPASNTRLTVAAASRLADTTGQAYIRSTDAQAQDIGAQLTLGGLFNASAHYAFGGIAGRKENSTSGNVAGYLDFLTTTSAGALTSRMRIDSTGNVGIGVTPSAWWTGFKAVESSNGVALLAQTNVPYCHLVSNAYDGATNFKYKVSSNYALRYAQDATTGNHIWFNAGLGTAGNNITFTQAMTLDASGRLILLASTTTPATLATNGELTFTATSNTNLRFSYRGSDGVTRTADLTLA